MIPNISLTPSEIEELCQSYWHETLNDKGKLVYQFKINDLKKQYNLKGSALNQVIAHYGQLKSEKTFCSRCQTPFTFTNRVYRENHKSYDNNARHWTCKKCEQKNHFDALLAKKNLVKQIINENYAGLSPHYDVYSMSLQDKLFIYTLITSLREVDGEFSLDNKDPHINANYHFTESWLVELVNTHSIILTPTNFNAYELSSKKWVYNPSIISFKIRLPDGIESHQALAESILDEFKKLDLTKRMPHKEVLFLARLLINQNCQAYYHHIIETYDLVTKSSASLVTLFDDMMKYYSASQIRRLIWNAGKNAAAFKVRNNTSRQHAGNTMLTSLRNGFTKSIVDKWDVFPFNPDPNFPVPAMDRVLFSTILGDSGNGFDIKYNADIDLTNFTKQLISDDVD